MQVSSAAVTFFFSLTVGILTMTLNSVAAFSRAAITKQCCPRSVTLHRPSSSVIARTQRVATLMRKFHTSQPLYTHDDHQRDITNEDYKDNITTDNNNNNHRKYYSIKGSGKRSTVNMTTNTNHNLQTDVPIQMGGQNSAPQPVELLLASLIGCTQATAIYVGRMMTPRLLIDRIDFDINAYRDERGALMQPIDVVPSIPARLQCVSGTVKVYFKKGIDNNDDVTEEQLKVLGEQTEARCPVANMMHASGCSMDIKWMIGDE
jgi:putative redox protein